MGAMQDYLLTLEFIEANGLTMEEYQHLCVMEFITVLECGVCGHIYRRGDAPLASIEFCPRGCRRSQMPPQPPAAPQTRNVPERPF